MRPNGLARRILVDFLSGKNGIILDCMVFIELTERCVDVSKRLIYNVLCLFVVLGAV